MTFRQKTVVRIVVASLLLAGLTYREIMSGYSIHTIVLLLGIVFLISGILIVLPKRYTLTGRFMPNLEEQLTPVWGYGPPKNWRPIIAALDLVVGIALIAWVVFRSKY
jgi:hypothetical protein